MWPATANRTMQDTHAGNAPEAGPVFNDTLAQLVSHSGGAKRRRLPSWQQTVDLLESLHALHLMALDPRQARERLTSVVRSIKSQIEICTPMSDATALTNRFLAELPAIRKTLQEDIGTALENDPAAMSADEVILCYPGMRALAIYRTANALHRLDIPLLPRLMTEIGHSMTGIDIHPGAVIGQRFFIDHGTGIVIGATCVIGDDVKIYQGVTLGSRSFPKCENGQVIKGLQRHPVIGDKVTIFAGATILGRVHIGSGSVIGGNVWITSDVLANSKVVQRRPRQT